jgi:hypothetical protein
MAQVQEVKAAVGENNFLFLKPPDPKHLAESVGVGHFTGDEF